MEYVEESKLLKRNDIAHVDYLAYLVNINIEDYFEKEFSSWDNLNYILLDRKRKSHRVKFGKKLEE